MTVRSLLLLSLALAGAASAEEGVPSFALPLTCSLGTDCWIARHVDRGPGVDVSDFNCGRATQNGHRGTDIMVADLDRMRRGVDVIAAAEGTVLAVRDGVADISIKDADAAEITGRECGNAVVIGHGNGWQSQYCHLKNGGIRVARGDTVAPGQVIGAIGLSGQTEYPHLHFAVRHHGQVIDPFDGGTFEGGCDGADKGSLWADDPEYAPAVLLPPEFSAAVPERARIWDASASAISPDAPALVLTQRAFHVSAGDQWHFILRDPAGHVFHQTNVTIEKDQQFRYAYVGRKAPRDGFTTGTWTGTVTVTFADSAAPPQRHVTSIVVRPIRPGL